VGTNQPDDDTGQPSDDEIIAYAIESAEAGDAEAGRELLRHVALGLASGKLHPLLAAYHADCLWNHIQLGVSLERALHVYKYQIRSTGFDPIELAAVFELLTEFAGMKKGEARNWIKDHIGAGKKVTENANAAVDIQALGSPDPGQTAKTNPSDPVRFSRERYLDLLLHTAGSMRKVVVEGVDLK
jgi:hypothetical protein